jgi:hypothetical protein
VIRCTTKQRGNEASKPFKGTIDVDTRDSTPDWEPYLQPVAPEGGAERLD